MNPELLRNLWIEAAPRRLAIMAGVLAFLFATIWVSAPTERLRALAGLGETLFYFLVVVWGTRNAASSVVDEIRDRTWDLQRLSAISPWEMVWGKLLGSTSYVWAGGAICASPVILFALSERGAEAAVLQLVFFVSIGLIGHSAAMLSSMVAVRRRAGQSRLNTFGFLAFGLIAAAQTWSIWASASPGALGITPWGETPISSITWYGREWPAPVFLLTSLALALGWLLAGCHQFMRHELAVRMNPAVWIAFLIFIAAYFAGFAWPDAPFTEAFFQDGKGATAGGWAIAAGVLLFATYVSLVVMPKERVQMRWVLSQFASGRIFSFLEGLPGWTYGFVFTAAAAAMTVAQAAGDGSVPSGDLDTFRFLWVAVLGELARNIGVFMFFNMLPGQRRGDFAAALTLVLLYGVAPVFLGALEQDWSMALISPFYTLDNESLSGLAGFSAVAMWAQAAIVWPFAMLRLSQSQS
jgi:hypothetical protein